MPTSLDLVLSPGMPALADVVSVLHARKAQPSRIEWIDGTDIATLRLDVPGCAELLTMQLARRVDVHEVTS
ncbi:MAG: hypothetical protein ABR549_08870 [Mycobacteriales bacterium]